MTGILSQELISVNTTKLYSKQGKYYEKGVVIIMINVLSKRWRNVISKILIVATLFVSSFVVMPNDVYAGSTKNDEKLVSCVSNPSNGIITFKIKCPAKSSIEYKLSLTPNKKNQSIDKYTGRFSNKSSKAVTKTFKYKVNYFSNLYKVSAKATVGNPRLRNYRTDTDSAKSIMVKNVSSKTSKWTAKRIRQYNAGMAVAMSISLAAGVAVDILATKGVVTKTQATAFSVVSYSLTGGKIIGVINNEYSERDVPTIPRKNWSWKIEYKRNGNSSYTAYLVVLDDTEKTKGNYKLGTYTYNTITAAI